MAIVFVSATPGDVEGEAIGPHTGCGRKTSSQPVTIYSGKTRINGSVFPPLINPRTPKRGSLSRNRGRQSGECRLLSNSNATARRLAEPVSHFPDPRSGPCLVGKGWPDQPSSIFTMTSCGVGWRSRCGRELRSSRPARPSRLPGKPFADGLRADRLRPIQRPSASARSARGARSPLSTLRRQACILMDVHSVLRKSLKLRNRSFLRLDRVDNLLKAHN